MGQTTDIVDFIDSTAAVAPPGGGRLRKSGPNLQWSVDGEAYQNISAGGAGGGGGGLSAGIASTYGDPFEFTLSDASANAVILAQWTLPLDLLPEGDVIVNLGVITRRASGGNLFPTYGIFVLPDGDVDAADLFTEIEPDVEINAPSIAATFAMHNSDETIANPGAAKQILLAVKPNSTNSENVATVHEYRSVAVNVLPVASEA